MTEKEILEQFIYHLEQDINSKDFLTYREQKEWEDYLKSIINNRTKEKDKEIRQLKNKIKEVIETLGQYKHYSTPTEEQNRENEEIVDNAYNILKGGSDE